MNKSFFIIFFSLLQFLMNAETGGGGYQPSHNEIQEKFYAAIQAGHLEFVEKMVASGAKIDCKGLFLAIKNNRVNLVRFILSVIDNDELASCECISIATFNALNGDHKILRLLLNDNRTVWHKYEFNPISLAIDYAADLFLYIEKNSSYLKLSKYPRIYREKRRAAKKNVLRKERLLHGANRTETLRELLQSSKINVNQDHHFPCKKPIHVAVKKGNITALKILLEYKDLDVNLQDYKGRTALIIAAQKNDIQAVRLLLSHPKIDLYIRDNENKTAYNYADFKIAKLLSDARR
jgi:ankyrin repeat protein